jgi:hypothetical protein
VHLHPGAGGDGARALDARQLLAGAEQLVGLVAGQRGVPGDLEAAHRLVPHLVVVGAVLDEGFAAEAEQVGDDDVEGAGVGVLAGRDAAEVGASSESSQRSDTNLTSRSSV